MQEGGYSAKNGAKDSTMMRGSGAEAGVSKRVAQWRSAVNIVQPHHSLTHSLTHSHTQSTTF
jgi:hypothetical protein